MKYWIISLPRDDMEHCLKLGVFGRNHKHTISNVEEGDKVAFVVTKERPWKLIALGQAKSSYYIDDSRLFVKEGMFIDRFDFTAMKFDTELEPDFNSLVADLSFVTKPVHWPVYFKMGITKMTAEDWQLLCSAVSDSQ